MNRRKWLGLSALAATGAFATRGQARSNGARPGSGVRAGPQATGASEEGPIRLDANENPYGPSPRALAAHADAAKRGGRYPIEELRALTNAIAERERVEPGQVIVGTGSGEILCAAALAWGRDRGAILAAHPTFEQLPDYARRAGVPVGCWRTTRHGCKTRSERDGECDGRSDVARLRM